MPSKKAKPTNDVTSENLGEQDIIVDFEGKDVEDGDFDGIKQLLHQLFLSATVNTGNLTDIIIGQRGLGSVIKQCCDYDEDDSDDDGSSFVFGITTMLSLTKEKNQPSVQGLVSYLLDKAKASLSPDNYSRFETALNLQNHKVGFLINERFVNIPYKIAAPLFASLQNELPKSSHHTSLEYFITILKLYKDENESQSEIFANPEEEKFQSKAILHFDYSVRDESDTAVAGNWDADDETTLIPFRRVLLLRASDFSELVKLVDENN